ncbi:MAG: phosphatidylglycerol lysyltransferase domain-containing protein [Bacillota bacterium]
MPRSNVISVLLVRSIVGLVLLCALVNVLSAITPALPERIEFLRDVFSPEFRAASRIAAAFSGFALLLLARGLVRRQRVAWILTIVVLLLSMAAHMIKGLDIEEAALSSVVVAVMLYARGEFFAKSDRPSIQSGLSALGLALLFTLVYGTLGFFFLDRHFGQHFNLVDAFIQTLNLFLLGPQPVAHTRFAKWFLDSIYIIGWTSLGTGLIAFLQPVIMRGGVSQTDRLRAERIVRQHGRSSLARFALLGDKQFYFHSSGDSLVSYVAVSGIGLALGDPIGPPERIGETVQGFVSFCAGNGWKPVFYQTAYVEPYESAGLMCLSIGECALVDVAEFTLEGPHHKEIRNAFSRLTRDGYRFRYYPAPQPPERIARLRRVSDEWLAHKAGNEKSFSLGAFEEGYIRESPVVTLEDSHRNIVAFANLVPTVATNEIAVDLMRQREIAPTGAMLAVLAEAIRISKENGYRTFNLGLAPLAGVGNEPSATALEKALHLVFERVTEPYNFRGLYVFKKKFHPRFETRYLACPSVLDVIPALQAVTAADGSVSLWREAIAELTRKVR